jgi:pyrroline-5-carboxylate reductase
VAKTQDCIGVIGLGRMGRCLVNGLYSSSPKDSRPEVFFTTKHSETAKRAANEMGVSSCSSNTDLVKRCSTILLGVKPQNIFEVLDEIKGVITEDHTLVSIVASISTDLIESRLGKKVPVIRAMPNTPAFVKEAITAACVGAFAREKDWDRMVHLFKPVGKLVRVDEKHMNAVTGLSGCGPAYFYVILESLTDAGIKVGLPRELASQLASQTMLGAAKMLQETGKHPAALKDEVTTPSGCTIDGLMELEEGKLRVTLIKAVVQATRRAEALVKAV